MAKKKDKTEKLKGNSLQIILTMLLVVAAFAIGSMWTQIKTLKIGKQASKTPVQQEKKAVVTLKKSDKPKVELFIMTYCPYGFQTQKAIIPVMELLRDKADIAIRFVSYAMHGKDEIEENLRQYCIQKNQYDKYIGYSRCFVASNDTVSCQKEAGIDVEKLQNCYSTTDKEFGVMKDLNDKSSWLSGRFPLFNVEKGLNDKYKVKGSPALVINGQVVNAPRSSEALKQVICSAFNKPPADDQTILTRQFKIWMDLLINELSVLKNTFVVTLGEPLINQLIHTNSKKVKDYWDYTGKTKSGKNFKCNEPYENYLQRRIYPIAHQPTWNRNKFYKTYLNDYLEYIKQNEKKSSKA